MAYINQSEDELKKKQQQDTLAGTEGVGIADKPTSTESSVIAGTGSASTPATQAATTAAPKVAGGFTDVNKYLDPNKAQTLGLANKVAGVIGSDVKKAQETMGQQRDAFGNLVKQGTNVLQQDPYNKLKGYLTTPTTPTNPEDVKKFQEMYSGTYKGPQAWEGSDYEAQTTKQIQDAQREAGLVDTLQGRKELLGKLQTAGRQSKGAADLNAALLQRDADAFSILQGAKKQAEPLQSNYDQLKAALGEQVKGAKATSQETVDKLKKEFDPNSLAAQQAAKAEEAKQKYLSDVQAYKDSVKKQYAIDTVGIDPLSQAYWNTKDATQFTPQATATKEDMQRMALLSLLTGGTNVWEGQEAAAGTAPQFSSDIFNKEKYMADYNLKKKQDADLAAQMAWRPPTPAPPKKDVVSQVVNYVSSGGCFVGRTLIDGCPIIDITVGGDIYAKHEFIRTEPLYDYCGVIVTGSHAVKEDGVWRRVAHSEKAVLSNCDEEIVYNYSCTSHRIIINGIEFADFDEVDDPTADLDESLNILNGVL